MIFFLLLLFFFFSTSSQPAHAVTATVGNNAPDFTLSTIDGRKFSLSDYQGSIVVLVYLKSGQRQSSSALKDSRDFSKAFHEQGVQFLGLISGTENQGEIRTMVEELSIDFPILIDTDRRVYSTYGVRVYPTTILIDREGKISHTIPGHALVFRATLEGYLHHVLEEIDESQIQDTISPRKRIKVKSDVEAERKYNLALKFTGSGLIEQAKDAVIKSIELNPDSASAHTLLGFLYLDSIETENAMLSFRKALELDPLSHDAR
ncbi:MAG: redoxin domain-containing protein, partial [Nitrospiraceae bacterium]